MNPNHEASQLTKEEVDEREATSQRYTQSIVLFYSVLVIIAFIVGLLNSLAGLTFVCTIILHVAASIRSVGINQVAGILFAGRYLRDVGPGITFVLFGICTLSKDRADTVEDEHPAPARLIHRVKEGEPENIEPGKFAPVRITFADAKGDSEDALDKRLTVEVSFITRYRIRDYRKFLRVVTTLGAAKKSLEDVGFALLMEEFSKVSLADAQEGMGDAERHVTENGTTVMKMTKGYNSRLQDALNVATKNWGIVLEMAKVLPFGNSRELNTALMQVPEAILTAKATVIKADADMIERTRRGEGDGAGEKARLTGRAEGSKTMKDTLGIDPELVIASETARSITEKPGGAIILGGGAGFKDIIGTAQTIAESLRKEKV